MSKGKKRKGPIYQQFWFWGIIIAAGVILYLVLNLDNLITQDFNPEREINVYTREVGSGTRSSFVEAIDLVDDQGDDAIAQTATVQNSTNATMQAVASDPHGISYISLGSLNDSVKTVSVNGYEPTAENIQSGDYAIVRNFNMVYGQDLSEVAQDFWDFMFSEQAQEIVTGSGYVPVDPNAPVYESAEMSGSIQIVGSTSVESVVQLFAEAYTEYNPDVTIDITSPGSGAGITTSIDGSADIGMSSREPSADEMEQLIESAPIAIDGIVIIVNNMNPVTNLDLEQVQGIYSNEIDYFNHWNEVLED